MSSTVRPVTGVAGVRLVEHVADRVGEHGVGGEELDLGPRHHHLVELAVRRAEHVGEHAALLGVQLPVRAHHVAQLLLGDLVAPGPRVQAEHPHDDVGRRRQQPDDRARQCGHAVERRGDQQRDPLAALQGQPLGDELAEHQRQVGDEGRHGDERDGARDWHTPRDEHLAQRLRQGRPAVRGGEEPREGHPDLHGREEPVRVDTQLPDAVPPLAGQPVDLAVTQRDNRQFGSREVAADQHEHQDEREAG
jgi:hypothetical protein